MLYKIIIYHQSFMVDYVSSNNLSSNKGLIRRNIALILQDNLKLLFFYLLGIKQFSFSTLNFQFKKNFINYRL